MTRLYREYVGRKQKNRVLDFDDLLLYWHVMMQNPVLAQSLSKNFDHVLVDEYQDTSSLQGEVIQALKPDGRGVTVVGDDAQAIYSFRAAAVENILGFADRYKPKAEIVVLSQNYRSTQQVLDSANALMADGARQHRKTLLGMRQSNQKPFYVAMDDAQAQAEYISGKILQTREIGGSLRRHAILFRSSHHSDVLEVEFAKRNIPYVKYGGMKFLEAAHVKDMMSVLRWADNPRNSVAGFRVLKLVPGFGPGHAKQALDHLEAQGYAVKSLAGFDAPQPVKMEWKRFCALLEKLADPATPWGGPGRAGARVVQAAARTHLRCAVDAHGRSGAAGNAGDPAHRPRAVPHRTDPGSAGGERRSVHGRIEGRGLRHPVHDSFGQGQEWDIVYVLNVSDGNFPSEFSTGKPEMIEEERRLLYVAMTRARNELHLCAPLKYQVTQQPRDGDKHVYGAKSRFMTDKVLDTVERISLRNMRGVENLRESEAATVDVVAQLKEMW